MEAELEKLEYNLGGVRDMKRLPQAALIIDLKTEAIAVRECERLQIPILGLVDSNVDPVPVTFPIPGNDDSIRSCEMVVGDDRRGHRAGGDRLPRGRGQAPRRGGGAPPRRRGGEARSARPRSRRARRPRRRRRPRRGCRAPQAARPSRQQAPQRPRPAAQPRPTPVHPQAVPADPEPAPGRRTAEGRLMAVTAADVKALRDRTGAAMMDCKAALAEAGGDPDKAIEILRVKGQASAAKRSGRGDERGRSSPPTSTPAARSACWSRSSARPTSSPATTTSRSSRARSRSTSPARRRPALRLAPTRSPRPSVEAERKVFEAKAREEGKPDNVRRARSSTASSRSGRRRSRCSSRSTCARTATRARRSSSCAPRSPRRPARTSASPASRASGRRGVGARGSA